MPLPGQGRSGLLRTCHDKPGLGLTAARAQVAGQADCKADHLEQAQHELNVVQRDAFPVRQRLIHNPLSGHEKAARSSGSTTAGFSRSHAVSGARRSTVMVCADHATPLVRAPRDLRAVVQAQVPSAGRRSRAP